MKCKMNHCDLTPLILQSVTCNKDIATIILEKTMLLDLSSMSRTCWAMQKLTKEVTRRQFICILALFTGSEYASFRDALRTSDGVITGSATRTMLLGGETVEARDLNIVVPHKNFDALENFVGIRLGYKKISCRPHPAISPIIACFGKYASRHHIITISAGKRDTCILHIILNAPTTADMLFMTTGGLTWFYPEWMQYHIAIQSHTGDLVPQDNKLGCMDTLLENIVVAKGTGFIGKACGVRCPALWHHIEEKHMRLSVDWNFNDSVTKIFHNVDIEWRLNMHCTNSACAYNVKVMSENCESNGATNHKY